MLRRSFLAATLGLLTFLHGGIYAQDFPSKPVHIIVGYAAGGPTDILARLAGERLSRLWDQPVVVENRPGAGGLIALDAVRRAPADGQLIGVLNLNHVVAQELLPKPTFDISKELAPISGLARQGNVLVVHPSVPAKTPMELVAHLKANAGKVNFASGGNGSPAHLAGELFKKITGVEMTHVAYKGAAPGLQDVTAGHVALMFAAAPPSLPLVKAGKLRAIAVTSAERMEQFPDVPTLAESGIDVKVQDWQGLVVPAGTPGAIISRINADLLKVIDAPDFKARVTSLGGETAGSNPADFAAFIAAEAERWRQVIRETGITSN